MPIIAIGGNASSVNATGSILVASGSIGQTYTTRGNENTASLGLSGSIGHYTASLDEVISNTSASYEMIHLERTAKFVTAKVYDNINAISNVYAGNNIYYGANRFNQRVRGMDGFQGKLIGNADTATTATNATNVRVTANNTTNETTYILFADGAGTTNQGVESDTSLTYNPRNNLISSTITNAHTASIGGGSRGSNNVFRLTSTDFHHIRGILRYDVGNFRLPAEEAVLSEVWMPHPCTLGKQFLVIRCGIGDVGTVRAYITPQFPSTAPGSNPAGPSSWWSPVLIGQGNVNAVIQFGNGAKLFNPLNHFLTIDVTAGGDADITVYGGTINYVTM